MPRVTFVLMRSHVFADSTQQAVAECRDDITHQCLLALLDSPLCQSGRVSVLVQSRENMLVEISGAARLPRSLHRFRGLMRQLLRERRITDSTGQALMRIVKNPVSEHIAPGAVRFGLSQSAERCDRAFFETHKARGYAVFLNASQRDRDAFPDTEFSVRLSDYPLSAFVCCTKACSMFEEIYGVF